MTEQNKSFKGVIICAFPATGKTTAINNAERLGISACDSDSEDYHWVDRSVPKDERVERPNWILNYIKHLKKATESNDYVFASTHEEVREALVTAGIDFVVVYPTREQKDEFVQRALERTSGLHGESGANLLAMMWDTWLDQLEGQIGCSKVVLKSGQYLSDVLYKIKN